MLTNTTPNTTTEPPSRTRSLLIDLAVYAGFLLFALATAVASTYRTHSTWGLYATVGYGLAAGYTGFLLLRARGGIGAGRWWESRWVAVGVAFVVGMLAPLVDLVLRRLGGGDWARSPGTWAAQPEVWVIERSAGLLLDHGTPYVDVHALGRPPVVDDYTPYGPVMSLFGLPRTLALELGLDGPVFLALTDARLVFAAVAVACIVLGLRLLGRPNVPVAAAQLAVIFPSTAMTWAVAGPDLAILGLLVLSLVLAVRGHYLSSGVLLALVVGAKLTAAPAVLVLLVLVAVRGGWPKLAGFTAAFAATTAVVHVPVVLADPAAFVEHVIAFPAGQGAVASPAASPLPGHLIAETGPVGHTIALTLLGLAAVAIAAWVLLRPPATGSDAALRIAVGLGTAIILTPATRWGYIVYPLVMLGARLCFPDPRATPVKPDRPSETVTSSSG